MSHGLARWSVLSAVALTPVPLVFAQTLAPGVDAQRRQEDQREQMEQRANERPSVLNDANDPNVARDVDLNSLPLDTPCFPIRALRLDAGVYGSLFRFIETLLQPVVGQCIGKSAIQVIQDTANNALIARGYVTSRVLVPQQNLASGTLLLTLIPGRVSAVRRDPESGIEIGWSRMALPFYPDAVYNQRDVDQAVETVRRLAGQGETAFDVAPGENPGDSILVIRPSTGERWHATIGTDNYGLDSTGRYELNGSITFDSPLHLYDQLTLSGNTNADVRSANKASRSQAVNWNVPVGYASLFFNASRSRYLQTVAGFDEPLRYSGNSAELNAGVGYVPYRSASARTSSQLKLYHRYNRGYLNDESIDYQYRDLIGFEATLSHQQYMGRAVLNAGVGWRQTLLGVTNNPGAVIGDSAWNGKSQIATGNLQATVPFSIGGQPLRYAGQFNWQHARTPVIPNDDFTIGSPYTVRGFDGQTTLAAESGWTWRNELGVQIGGQLPFIALDAGRVSGPNTEFLTGTTLVGTALGVRGHLPASRFATLDYEVTLGWPLVKPRGFPSSSPTVLFQATTQF